MLLKFEKSNFFWKLLLGNTSWTVELPLALVEIQNGAAWIGQLIFLDIEFEYQKMDRYFY